MNKVYQIRAKIYTLNNIELIDAQEEVSKYIDTTLVKNKEFLKLHIENRYKGYVYDLPYEIEKDKVYKKDKIYTITIRTINSDLAQFLEKELPNTVTNTIKGIIVAEVKIIPKKLIETVWTLTPAIVKLNEGGYWRTNISIEEYEQLLTVNMIKKYNYFNNVKINEDFEFITQLEFLNKGAICVKCKGIILLADKLRIHVAENEMAQKLAYLSLGTGLMTHNSRGAGFLNYRWY